MVPIQGANRSALVKRDMLSEISYRFSFFMQIAEIFLTVAALYFLSRLIGQNTINQYLAPYGGNYFAFAIIGVAFYSYFNIGFSNFAAQLREAQTTGTLEAMLSTPAGLSTIVLGSSLWAFIMATLRVMVILLSGAFLMDSGMKTSNLPLALLILLLTVASASSFGIIAASFIMVLKRGDPISWLFKSASWLLGGVVFPVDVLPSLDAEIGTAAAHHTRSASDALGPAARKIHERHAPGNCRSLRVLFLTFTDQSSCT